MTDRGEERREDAVRVVAEALRWAGLHVENVVGGLLPPEEYVEVISVVAVDALAEKQMLGDAELRAALEEVWSDVPGLPFALVERIENLLGQDRLAEIERGIARAALRSSTTPPEDEPDWAQAEAEYRNDAARGSLDG